MDDPELTPQPAAPSGKDRFGMAATPAPRRRAAILPWTLFALALGAAVWLGWLLVRPPAPVDPLAVGLVAFEKQDRLTVFSAQLVPVVSSDNSQLFGLVRSRQVAVIPARVDYAIDLGKIGRDRMTWNASAQTLTVRLPQLMIGQPNLDEARAQYLREGVWITRTAQETLTRENTRLAERIAVEQARNGALLDLARAAAREAVAANIAGPLQMAGFPAARIVVVFDGEPAAH
ncbi:DUF4230 domain-containing protein [Novosphingobium sp.]|uniref:DUF4230 domain-containing protein n=1 Tax=Novosphingobium sp. TaxID=1874826 RepID=UPI0038B8C221